MVHPTSITKTAARQHASTPPNVRELTFTRDMSRSVSFSLVHKINDLPSSFGGGITVKMFADDVKIYLVANDINNGSVLQCWLDALF